MRLTPLDIREQQFRRVMRGMDPEEVTAFLANVAGEFETLLAENKEQRQRLLDLEEKLSEYRSMEKALRDTLLTAERVMTESKESAQREGALIIREAELAAQRAAARVAQDVARLRRELAELRRVKDAYLSRLRWLVRAHLEVLDGHAQEFAQVDAGIGPLGVAEGVAERPEPGLVPMPSQPPAGTDAERREPPPREARNPRA